MNSKNKKSSAFIKQMNLNVNVVDKLSNNKMVKDISLYINMRKKIRRANRMFSSGRISLSDYTDYIKKIKKETELIKKNVGFLDEILFETNDCTLSSVFKDGSIKYCINQYGMREYYEDLNKAIENFVRISI